MNTPPQAPPPTQTAVETPTGSSTEDRTVAIVSYLTLIGFVVAVILHSSKKTQLGAFHLRQTLGILLTAIGGGIAQIILAFIPILGWIAIFVMWTGLFVVWVMGLIAAINGQMKPAPIVGQYYQKWFANAFA